MNNNSTKLLEYDRIKEMLEEYAISELAKSKIRNLEPGYDSDLIRSQLNEVSEAKRIINRSSSVPIHGLKNVHGIMMKLEKAVVLSAEELFILAGLITEGEKLKRFMKDKESIAPSVSSYALSIYELQDLKEEIYRCIEQNRVHDKASNVLSRIRKKIGVLEERIKTKLENVLKNPQYKKYIQDSIISIRDGRYVIPIKSEFKKNLEGSLLDSSSSGSTVFIEPAEVRKIQDELNAARIDEEQEVYKILSTLTALAESYGREISINIETMAHYDFLFAKAKFSKALDGRAADLNNDNYMCINGGRHPLIGRSAVPLNFAIGKDYKSLVITGPNTGGKTVALKTVGLLTMMIQSGLHVPVDEGSEFAIFGDILTDIGDGQSIEQSLSTFSSHIKNIIEIMNCSDKHTLVILDELGAGTDPGEGMGLAIAVLENIYGKGAITMATTHYSEIKDFAEHQDGFKNGCMEFDINTLKPLYKLTIGNAGESNAFLIALRLGMPIKIIERAHEVTYKEKKSYEGINFELKVREDDQNLEKDSIQSHEKLVEKLEQTIENKERTRKAEINHQYNLGDCVYISSMGRTGIVCELQNSKGDVGVMVMKKKFKVNVKRLSMYIEGKELYPEEYDYDIVFESKDDRKKKKKMSKRHIEGMVIVKADEN